MSAFYIFQVKVKDPIKFGEYAGAAGPTIEKFGGEVVLKGKVVEVLAGKNEAETGGLLRFPDTESALAWYRSEEYQALIPTRDAGADVTITLFEAPPA